jgi:hypothetical protein
MTSLLIIAISSTVFLAVYLFRREIVAIGRAVVAGVLEFKARLKEIDDDLWRR